MVGSAPGREAPATTEHCNLEPNTGSLSYAVQMAKRSDDDQSVGNRRRGHDDFVHVVAGDLLQIRTGRDDENFAVFASDVQPAVRRNGRRGECAPNADAAAKRASAGFRVVGRDDAVVVAGIEIIAVHERRGDVRAFLVAPPNRFGRLLPRWKRDRAGGAGPTRVDGTYGGIPAGDEDETVTGHRRGDGDLGVRSQGPQ